MNKIKQLVCRAIRNSDGKVVIIEPPNLPITGWVLFKIISMISDDKLALGSSQVSNCFLFVWAYLEITKGDSPIRRLAGIIVMTFLIRQLYR